MMCLIELSEPRPLGSGTFRAIKRSHSITVLARIVQTPVKQKTDIIDLAMAKPRGSTRLRPHQSH